MIQPDRLLQTFLDLVRIPSPSGQEAEIAQRLLQHLQGFGLEAELDESGNVLAHTRQREGALLLGAHMDTVGKDSQITPVIDGDVVRSDGSTILGGDDKSGIAVILEVIASSLDEGRSIPPIEVLFTVQEENGLVGAKAAAKRGNLVAREGIEMDSGGPIGTIIVQAPAQDSVKAAIHGRKAHAGSEPEKGINAIRVAAEAVAAMPLGRIDADTTANIGVIEGGVATNVVPDLVHIRGEARSRVAERLDQQTAAMVKAFQESCDRHGARLDLEVTRAYEAYQLTPETPIVKALAEAVQSQGYEPLYTPSGGGSDGNVFNAVGITTTLLSTGMEAVHTTDECIRLSDMVAAAQIMEALLQRRAGA